MPIPILHRRDEEAGKAGFVLPAVLVAMVTMAIIAMAALRIASDERLAARALREFGAALFAAEAGADAIQLALPFWQEVPDSHVVGFFQDVSRASGGLPLSIYDTRSAKKVLTLEQHRG